MLNSRFLYDTVKVKNFPNAGLLFYYKNPVSFVVKVFSHCPDRCIVAFYTFT